MEEYVFYVGLTVVLVLLNQLIGRVILGFYPIKIALVGLEVLFGTWTAKAINTAFGLYLVAAVAAQAWLWTALPAWFMVSVNIVVQAWAVERQFKMKSQLRQCGSFGR